MSVTFTTSVFFCVGLSMMHRDFRSLVKHSTNQHCTRHNTVYLGKCTSLTFELSAKLNRHADTPWSCLCVCVWNSPIHFDTPNCPWPIWNPDHPIIEHDMAKPFTSWQVLSTVRTVVWLTVHNAIWCLTEIVCSGIDSELNTRLCKYFYHRVESREILGGIEASVLCVFSCWHATCKLFALSSSSSSLSGRTALCAHSLCWCSFILCF